MNDISVSVPILLNDLGQLQTFHQYYYDGLLDFFRFSDNYFQNNPQSNPNFHMENFT